MQDAKSLVEPFAWENVACPGPQLLTGPCNIQAPLRSFSPALTSETFLPSQMTGETGGGHPFSEVRHPGLPSHRLSMHPPDDTAHGVDLVPIHVFTQ